MISTLQLNIPLVVSVLSLCISVISTFYYTRQSNNLSYQTRIANLVDKMYELSAKREELMKRTDSLSAIAEVQLQMKHLLFEIDNLAEYTPLSQPQKRLLADSFEYLLYFDYADKYWTDIFKETFPTPEVEAEYYRRYGQFLYFKGDFEKGKTAMLRSLKLPNNNDSRRYINFHTYIDWANLEYKRRAEEYALGKSTNRNLPVPKFDKVDDILKQAYPLLQSINNYTLYVNAVNKYNETVFM